jgi:CRP/FNR family transcriptional regulator, cyclic AMP receptor protein
MVVAGEPGGAAATEPVAVELIVVGSRGDVVSDHVTEVLHDVVRTNSTAGLRLVELDVDADADRAAELEAWVCPTIVVGVGGVTRRRLTGLVSQRTVLQTVLPLMYHDDRALSELRRQLGSPGERFPDGSGRQSRRTTITERVALLGEVDLFAGLAPEQLADLAAATDEMVFEAGTYLTEEGEPGDEFFVVVHGQVEVLQQGRLVATLGASDRVGEMSLLDDLPRSATVRAVGEVTVLAIGRATFRSLLVAEPTIALALLASLSRRLRG